MYYLTLNAWEQLPVPSFENSLVQEVLLLALALIDANSFYLQDGKLNFAAVFCYFCKNTSFPPEDLIFVLE